MIDMQEFRQEIVGCKSTFESAALLNGSLLTFAQEAVFAQGILQSNDSLKSTTMSSVKAAVLGVASVGLTLNPALGYAYLVPRKGHCCLDISYRGLARVAADSGVLRYVEAEVIRVGDTFKFNGKHRTPSHEFNPLDPERSQQPVMGAYCVLHLTDATLLTTVIDDGELKKIQGCSQRSKAWDTFTDEMRKKAVIKRALKLIPFPNTRIEQAIAASNAADSPVGALSPSVSDKEVRALIGKQEESPKSPSEKKPKVYEHGAPSEKVRTVEASPHD